MKKFLVVALDFVDLGSLLKFLQTMGGPSSSAFARIDLADKKVKSYHSDFVFPGENWHMLPVAAQALIAFSTAYPKEIIISSGNDAMGGYVISMKGKVKTGIISQKAVGSFVRPLFRIQKTFVFESYGRLLFLRHLQQHSLIFYDHFEHNVFDISVHDSREI